MLKKAITYVNWNDEKVTEEFYFNLSKAELAEMEMTHKGGLEAHLKEIVEAENAKEVLGFLKLIVHKAVGKRSEDGRKFIKNDDIRSDLFDTGAYDELFMELMTDENEAARFIVGIIPKTENQDQDKPDSRDIELQKLRAQLEGRL